MSDPNGVDWKKVTEQLVSNVNFLCSAYTTLHNDVIKNRNAEMHSLREGLSTFYTNVMKILEEKVNAKIDETIKDSVTKRVDENFQEYKYIGNRLKEIQEFMLAQDKKEAKINIRVDVDNPYKHHQGDMQTPEWIIERILNHHSISRLERNAIIALYGLNKEGKKTQKEIAKMFGVSSVSVMNTRKQKILRKIRKLNLDFSRLPEGDLKKDICQN